MLTNPHMSSQLHKELNILGILLHTFETTEVHPLMKVKIDVPSMLLKHSDNSFTACFWANKRPSLTNTKSHILLGKAEIKTLCGNGGTENR